MAAVAEPLIGRGDVAIRDPLARLLELSERHARWVDDIATEQADAMAALDDEALARRAAAAEAVFETLDPQLLEQERALAREYQRREDVYLRALEEYGIARVRAMGLPEEQQEALSERLEQTFGPRPSRDITAAALDEPAERVLDAALLAAAYEQRKNELSGPAGEIKHELFGEPSGLDADLGDETAELEYETEETGPLERVEHIGQYLGEIDWTAGFPDWLAAAREQQMRMAERSRDGRAVREGDEVAAVRDRAGAAGVRQLGEPRETAFSPFEALASGAIERIVGADEVSPPPVLDALRPIIGHERAEQVSARLRLVEGLMERAPDAWIERRRAELGPPNAGLADVAALETGRLERATKSSRATLTQALADADAYSARDPERAAVAQRTAASSQRELDDASARLAELDRDGRHLDHWLAGDDDRLLRSLMYVEEARTRWYRDAAQSAELSVVTPPAHIVATIGERPSEPGLERDRYDTVTRELEMQRLLTESADAWNLEPPPRRAREERALDRRIENIRPTRGMGTGRAAGDAPGLDLG